MDKIIVQKDFVYLYLSKEFYDEKTIKSSLSEYVDFFNYDFKMLGDYFVLKIQTKLKEYSNELLANEFSNYLIGEMM